MTAPNGEKHALDALDCRAYDLVFMDVQMPVMGGIEATEEICRRYPRGQRPYIAAMTANAMKEDEVACRAAGMDDYVSKPVRAHELKGAIERAAAARKL